MKKEMNYTMKVVYWIAILGLISFVAFIGWELFVTIYGGIKH
ncbi:MAG: hypothetical protein ACFHVJ_14580 [Aestuariibacter sp.]